MPKSQNQKLKLLYLYRILLERTDEEHSVTLTELLDTLKGYGVAAERKSIYDDLEMLRVYGLDVQCRKGKAYGYFVGQRSFELAELKLLVDAIQSSKFITHRKSNELIKKIEALSSTHQAKVLQRQVFVANRIKTMNESIYYNIDKLHSAISAGRMIRFRYYEWTVDDSQKLKKRFRHGGADYRVSPWALTWDDENYYLVGFDAAVGIIKHYRVDKMSGIDMMGESRSGQEHFERFDMAVYSKKMFGMFGGREADVELAFDNSLAGVFVDRFGKDVFLTKQDSERSVAHVKAAVSPQFFAWVLGLGAKVKIVAPEDVVQDFSSYVQGILAQY